MARHNHPRIGPCKCCSLVVESAQIPSVANGKKKTKNSIALSLFFLVLLGLVLFCSTLLPLSEENIQLDIAKNKSQANKNIDIETTVSCHFLNVIFKRGDRSSFDSNFTQCCSNFCFMDLFKRKLQSTIL